MTSQALEMAQSGGEKSSFSRLIPLTPLLKRRAIFVRPLFTPPGKIPAQPKNFHAWGRTRTGTVEPTEGF